MRDWDTAPIMENQMEEKTQNDVNVRLMSGFISIREKKMEAATL